MGALNACLLIGYKKAVGNATFNNKFPAGTLTIDNAFEDLVGNNRIAGKLSEGKLNYSTALPGDYFYMKNKNDYKGGYYTGENLIYIGNNKFSGLGRNFNNVSEGAIREELRKAYVRDTKKPLDTRNAKNFVGFTNHHRAKLK